MLGNDGMTPLNVSYSLNPKIFMGLFEIKILVIIYHCRKAYRKDEAGILLSEKC